MSRDYPSFTILRNHSQVGTADDMAVAVRTARSLGADTILNDYGLKVWSERYAGNAVHVSGSRAIGESSPAVHGDLS